MTLANKIKALCKEKNISVHKLEMELGFGNGYIMRLTDAMPTDRAVKVAEYFGLPSDYFLPGQQKKDSAPQNPLIIKIMNTASTLSEAELKELLSFADYIQSKHKGS